MNPDNADAAPLVSVVVPVYGVERYLDQCVGSIVAQTYENLEIVLVDDGSPDRCPRMCDDWGLKDGRIRVIHQQNRGLSAARNVGIENASGEYLLFVDSDDWIDDHLVESCVAKALDESADMVVFTYSEVSANGSVMRDHSSDRNFPRERRSVNASAAIRYLLTRLPMYSWSYFAERDVYLRGNIRFPEGRTMEDIATTYRVFSSARSVFFLQESLYSYRSRPMSTMSTPSLKRIEDSSRAVDELESNLSLSYPKLASEINNWSFISYLWCLTFLYENKTFFNDSKYRHFVRMIKGRLYNKESKVKLEYLGRKDYCKLFLFRMHLIWIIPFWHQIRGFILKFPSTIK
ncbi:MAG: glycosyltransferase [Bifidobacterium minimum]|jgi:glycosyltransferase involved in cell wall biosynthesis|nr:glycosyltransferase [Bifidobacterium minimum]